MMKKCSIVILAIFILLSCIHANKPISKYIEFSPKTSSVQVLNMSNNSEKGKYTPSDNLLFKLAIIEDLISEKNHFKGESYNDTPTNITTYYSIVIMNDDRQHTIHIYEQNKKYYAEIPYSGIWEISDRIYQKMTKLFA